MLIPATRFRFSSSPASSPLLGIGYQVKDRLVSEQDDDSGGKENDVAKQMSTLCRVIDTPYIWVTPLSLSFSNIYKYIRYSVIQEFYMRGIKRT